MIGYVEYHGLVITGIFDCTLYNKVSVKNLVENHMGADEKGLYALCYNNELARIVGYTLKLVLV